MRGPYRRGVLLLVLLGVGCGPAARPDRGSAASPAPASTEVSRADRRRGALLGLAWGDALGCPVETWPAGWVEEVYGPYRTLPRAYPRGRILRLGLAPLWRLRPLGLHSDDTQQALALLHEVREGEAALPARWARFLVAGRDAGAWRGTGRHFDAAVDRLGRGVDPRRAGSRSMGIGAAMRAGVLGALPWSSPSGLAGATYATSLVTHGDLRAASLAYAVAAAVEGFVAGASPARVGRSLYSRLRRAEEEWRDHHPEWEVERVRATSVSAAVRDLVAAQPRTPADVRRVVRTIARRELGDLGRPLHPNDGVVFLGGLHALGLALLSEVLPEEALASVMQRGGDTDTVGAILGGLLGARFGPRWIPTGRLADAPSLERYAAALARSRPPPEPPEALLAREAAYTRRERVFQVMNRVLPGLGFAR